jgi:hypothetical protein
MSGQPTTSTRNYKRRHDLFFQVKSRFETRWQLALQATTDTGSRKQVNDLYTNILHFHLLQTRPRRLSTRNNLSRDSIMILKNIKMNNLQINYRRLELINSTDINRSLTSVDRPKLNSFLFRNRVLLLWSSFPSYLPFVSFFLILENKNKKQTLIYKRI